MTINTFLDCYYAQDKIKGFKMSVIPLLFYVAFFVPSILCSCYDPGLLYAVQYILII